MKKLLFIPLGLLAVAAQAQTISFTTSEGYSNGSLNAQPSSGSTWSTSIPATIFTVNTAGSGSMFFTDASPTANFQAAQYGQAISLSTFEIAMDFVYTRGVLTPASDLQIFRFDASITSDLSQNGIFSTLQQRGGSTDFRLQLQPNNVTGLDNQNSAFFSASLLGLSTADNSDNVSDLLRLSMGFVNTGGDDWTSNLTLTNLDTATAVSSIANYSFTSPEFTAATNKYLHINVGQIRSLPGSTVSIDQFSIVPEPSTFALLAGATLGLVLIRRRR